MNFIFPPWPFYHQYLSDFYFFVLGSTKFAIKYISKISYHRIDLFSFLLQEKNKYFEIFLIFVLYFVYFTRTVLSCSKRLFVRKLFHGNNSFRISFSIYIIGRYTLYSCVIFHLKWKYFLDTSFSSTTCFTFRLWEGVKIFLKCTK